MDSSGERADDRGGDGDHRDDGNDNGDDDNGEDDNTSNSPVSLQCWSPI